MVFSGIFKKKIQNSKNNSQNFKLIFSFQKQKNILFLRIRPNPKNFPSIFS